MANGYVQAPSLYSTGGSLRAAINPNNGMGSSSPPTSSSSGSSYTGPLANTSPLGEPFAVWLGFVLLLWVAKYLSEKPGVKILGEEVNPAHIKVGGYNWFVVGASAATFIALYRYIFTRWQVPGFSDFSNVI